jgi:site-specific recombinase XerC
LCPVDIYLQKLYKRIKGQRTYVDKTLHGYRRKLDEISNLVSALGFTLITAEVALYQHDITARLPMLNRLMISSLFCLLAGKSSPYLNFLVFKKDGEAAAV